MLPGARNVPGNPFNMDPSAFNMDPSAFCQNQVRVRWRPGKAKEALCPALPSLNLASPC